MPQLFLGVGHGITQQGTFDQGAQAPDRNEYEMNFQVVAAAAVALDRCGVSFFNEEAAGKGHDPDFAGSAIKANDLNVQLAIEVHHNAAKFHDGFGCEMCIHPDTTEDTRQLGKRIAALLHQALGLKVRGEEGLSPRGDLAFLRRTKMPAMIPEISFVDNDTDRKISGRADYATKAGEALAQAICEHFGKPFVPPHAAQPATSSSTSTARGQPVEHADGLAARHRGPGHPTVPFSRA